MDLKKLQAVAGAARSGKGGVRRSQKKVHKTAGADDKRLQSTLKRMGVNVIPGIEEVNIFQSESVIQFKNPKVQASIAANTYVVSGTPVTRSLADMIPQLLQQGAGGNAMQMQALQEMLASFQKGGAAGGAGASGVVDDDDDDVPDLVDNFEEATQG
ncbi:unnamed protein product [Pedinophyceae sp. YPF-701]|nr:unnamed protein product [Pedinophyceae sp. YPF-701]